MIDMDLSKLQPLALARGSHKRGSGKGCAMNVISWENGDTEITDYPECADRFLTIIVQNINDSICTHSGDGMLCPDCAVAVLRLAHRTPGTSGKLSRGDYEKAYLRTAAAVVEQVALNVPNMDRGILHAAVTAVRGWVNGGVDSKYINKLRQQFDPSLTILMPGGVGNSLNLAVHLLDAVPTLGNLLSGGDDVAGRCTRPVVTSLQLLAGGRRERVLEFAHREVFDRFESVTGIVPDAPDMDRIACAVRDMAVVG